MTLLVSYEQAWRTLRRIKAECGCELPECETLVEEARAVLNCPDPPRGEDKAFCLRILSGNILAG